MFCPKEKSRLVGLLVLAVVAAPAAQVRADNIPVEHLRELLLTVEVRKTLLDSPEVGSLNLGVRVDGRVATLWGPVPSPELKHRAEDLLRSFPYLSEVRNELHVQADDDVMPVVPVGDIFLREQPAWYRREAVSSGRELAAGATLAMHAQPAHTAHSPENVSPVRANAVPSPIDLESPEHLERVVTELQRTNQRYHSIRVRILARDVYLLADVSHASALYEMAQTVSRLPGVQQVVVREQ